MRKRSQIASFGLLHYLLLLPKTVLLTTPVHKSNLKHTSNKCSSEEEKVLCCTPLTPRRRGGDKELGEDQKINREAIWHRSTLETPTTVDYSAVFPSVPLCSLRDCRTSDHNNRGIYSCLNRGSVHKSVQPTREIHVHSGEYQLFLCVLYSQQGSVHIKCADTLLQLQPLFSFCLIV